MITNPPPAPSWRKPAGIGLMLFLITVWTLVIVTASDTIGGWPIAVQTVIYLVAGIVWILPLKPLLQWMETGKWRE